jgi:hypothetical protein
MIAAAPTGSTRSTAVLVRPVILPIVGIHQKHDDMCDGCAYLFYLQLLLRENGLTDLYLARTASTMLGAQALVRSAMQASNPGAGSDPRQQGQGAQVGARQQQGQRGVRSAAARPADKRSKLKRAISSRMQRQVSGEGSGDVWTGWCAP